MMLTARRSPLLTLALGALACASSGAPIRTPQPLRAEPTTCVSSIGTDTTVYDVGELDEKPVFRRALKLTYPPEAVHDHAQGRVVVTAIVNARGDVDQASVAVTHSVHPMLDAEARLIVASATLWPACRNGQAVRTRMAVPFDFAMQGPAIKVWQAFAIGVSAGIIAAMIKDTH